MTRVLKNKFFTSIVLVSLALVSCDRYHPDNDDVDFKFPTPPEKETNFAFIGGEVDGLIGKGLLLSAGTEELPIEENGKFEFKEPTDTESAPPITINTQPVAPSQMCTLTPVSDTAANIDAVERLGNQTVNCSCPAGSYTFSGTVAGLTNGSITLQNASDSFVLSQNGAFILNKEYANCSPFDLKIVSFPSDLACSLDMPTASQELGRFDGANIETNLVCISSDIRYKLNASVVGLPASSSKSLTIDFGTGSLSMQDSGFVNLQDDLANGAAYSVSISHDYNDLDCSIETPAGSINQGDRTVLVNCAPLSCRSYATQASVINSNGSDWDESCVLSAQQSQTVLSCERSAGGSIIGRSARYYDSQSDFIEEAKIGSFRPGAIRARFIEDFGPDDTTNQDGDSLTSAFYSGSTETGPERIVARSVVDIGSWKSATITINYSDRDEYSRPRSGVATADIDGVGGCKDISLAISYNDVDLTETYSPTGGTGFGQAAQEDPCPVTRNGLYRVEEYDVFGNYVYGQYYENDEAEQISWVRNRNIDATNDVCYANIQNQDVYQVDFTVTGLTGTLVLQNEGRNDYYVFANGQYSLPSEFLDGDSYNIQAASMPFGQSCLISAGSGTIDGANANVQVTCLDSTGDGYTVSARVQGLGETEEALELTNAGDRIYISGAGTFPFPLLYEDGAAYDVAIALNPLYYNCTVTDGNGIIAGASAIVDINCSYSGPVELPVAVSVSGLAGDLGVVLNASSTQWLDITEDGTYTFNETILTGTNYSAGITNAANQDCVLANSEGTVSAGLTLTVTCWPDAKSLGTTLQSVELSSLQLPAAVTADFNWDHALDVTSGLSRADGKDLALYFESEAGISLNLTGDGGLTSREATLPNSFTLETWFRTSSGNGGSLVAFTGNSGAGVRLALGKDGRLWAVIQTDSLAEKESINSFPGYNDGAWHHVALTFHPGAGLKLFADGTKVAGLTGLAATDLGPGYFRIGEGDLTDWISDGTSDGFLQAKLDETRISKMARYHESFSPAQSPLKTDAYTLALYHFDEVAGAIIDASGHSFNLSTDSTTTTWSFDSPMTSHHRRIAFSLAAGSSFNASDTTIDFKVQSARTPSTNGGSYYLYYGTTEVTELNLPGAIYNSYAGLVDSVAWFDSFGAAHLETGLELVLTSDEEPRLKFTAGSFIKGDRYTLAAHYNQELELVVAGTSASDLNLGLGWVAGESSLFTLDLPSDEWQINGSGLNDSSPAGGASIPQTLVIAITYNGTATEVEYRNDSYAIFEETVAAAPTMFYLHATGSDPADIVLIEKYRNRLTAADTAATFVAGGSGSKDQYQNLLLDLAELTWESIRGANTLDYEVVNDLNLYLAGSNGSIIGWASDNETVVADTGVVARPVEAAGPATVHITATVTNGNFSETKTFVILVPPRPEVYVSGAIEGLIGSDLELTLTAVGSETISTAAGATSFAFEQPIHEKDNYNLVVNKNPIKPSQSCSFSTSAGVAGTEPITADLTCTCAPGNYSLGGTVSGLISGSIELTDSAGGSVTVGSNGAFAFAGSYANCSGYDVTLSDSPADQACSVVRGKGFMDSAATDDILVQCESLSVDYSVAVSVYGTGGQSLTIQNVSAAAGIDETLVVTGDGYSSFTSRLFNGADYEATIVSAPAGLVCTVTPASGNIAGRNQLLTIDCGAEVCRDYISQSSVGVSGGTSFDTECSLGEDAGLWRYACEKKVGTTKIADVNTYYNEASDFVDEWPQGFNRVATRRFEYLEELPLGSSDVGDITQDAVYSNGRINRLVINSVINAGGWTPVTLTVNLTGYDSYDRPTAGLATAETDGKGGCRDINVSFNYDDSGLVETRSASGGSCFGAACLADACPYTRNAIFEEVAYNSLGLATVRRFKDAATTDESTVFTETVAGITTDSICYAPDVERVDYELDVIVSGLTSTLSLLNRGEDEVSLNGAGVVTFNTRLLAGEPYNVTIKKQPFGQECSVTAGAGTMPASNQSVNVACSDVSKPPGVYSLSVAVSGLTSGQLEISDDYGDRLFVSNDGLVVFPDGYENGDDYLLVIHNAPSELSCSIEDGSGVFTDNDLAATISCISSGPATYAIGGTVNNLAGTLTLSNNDTETIVVSGGTFSFSDRQLNGTSYAVKIEAFGTDQECEVFAGNGTIQELDISNIAVNCISSPASSSSHLRELTITADDAVPAGYSVNVNVDHEAMVNTGDSLASGDDVRVFWRPDSGSSLYLNGSDQHIYSSHEYSDPNQFTIELWFKTKSNSGGYLVGFADGTSADTDNNDRMLYVSNNGRIFFGVYNFWFRTVSSTPGYNDGEWHHVAATLDNGSGMQLFVDGSLVDENNSVTTGQSYNGYWKVGREHFGGFLFSWPSKPDSQVLAGQIDEVRVSNVRRYGDDFNPPIKQFAPDENTVWLLHFNEGSGNSVVDASGNANHAVLENGPGLWSPDSAFSGSVFELDRIADKNQSWNRNDTKLWFKLQRPLGEGRSTNPGEYVLYYGDPTAGTPPVSGNNVFAVYDDFESDNFASFWQVDARAGRIDQTAGEALLRIDYTIDGGYNNAPFLRAKAPYFRNDAGAGLETIAEVTNFSNNFQSLAGIYDRSGDASVATAVFHDSNEGFARVEGAFIRETKPGFNNSGVLSIYRDLNAGIWSFGFRDDIGSLASLGSMSIAWSPEEIGIYATNWDSQPYVEASFDYIQSRLRVNSEPTSEEGTGGQLADYNKLLEDMAAVTFDTIAGSNAFATAVTDDLNLIANAPLHGSSLSWSSANPAVLTDSGVVDRTATVIQPAEAVTLIAEFTFGGLTKEKVFVINILADPIIGIAAGVDHTCALLPEGTVYCFGDNAHGQLGFGNTTTVGDNETPGSYGAVPIGESAVQVVTGQDFTCILGETGAVRCFGRNNYGQLGIGSTESIGDNEIAAYGEPVRLKSAAAQITAGNQHACALLQDGDVSCWGRGSHGRLGYGNTDNQGLDSEVDELPTLDFSEAVRQVSAGAEHTCAVLLNGNVKCWGRGGSGRLGYGSTQKLGDTIPVSAIAELDFLEDVNYISAGGDFTCALLDGDAICWGEGQYGQHGYGFSGDLGDNSSATEQFPVLTGEILTGIDAGAEHVCAITDLKKTICWGRGSYGRLGYGGEHNIGDNETPDIYGTLDYPLQNVAVSAGSEHSCVLNENDHVYCWGRGLNGRLGQATTFNIGDNENITAISAVNLDDDGNGSLGIGGFVVTASGPLTVELTTNQGASQYVLSGIGSFELAGVNLTTGQSYSLSIVSPPTDESCSVSSAAGNMAVSDVTNILIVCSESSGGGGGSSGDLNSGDWGMRYTFTLDNSTGNDNLVDFPVLVELPSSFNWAAIKPNGGDIRFADELDNPLDFEFERWDYSNQALIWVKVPSIPAFTNSLRIRMYYDNADAIAGENPAGVWSNGYVAVYHLNDRDGTVWADSTAGGYDGTSSTSLNPQSAFIGDGVHVDNGGIDITSAIAGANTNSGTLETWYKASNASIIQLLGTLDIVGFQNTKFQYQCVLAVLGVCLSGWQNIYVIGGDFSIQFTNQNQWHNLTQKWDAGALEYYYEGSSVGTDSGSADFGSYGFIGAADGLGILSGFKGQVDEVRISSVARSDGWIEASYNNGLGNFVQNTGPEEPASVFVP